MHVFISQLNHSESKKYQPTKAKTIDIERTFKKTNLIALNCIKLVQLLFINVNIKGTKSRKVNKQGNFTNHEVMSECSPCLTLQHQTR